MYKPDTFTISNETPGVLRVGTIPNHTWYVGDIIEIKNHKRMTVTAIMGNSERTCLFFKGQGSIPSGEVTFWVVKGATK